jgi:hypothetical protein
MVSSLQSTSSLRKIADADSCKLRKWYIQISAYIFYLSDSAVRMWTWPSWHLCRSQGIYVCSSLGMLEISSIIAIS